MKKILLSLLFFTSWNICICQDIEQGIWLIELDYNWDKIEKAIELDGIEGDDSKILFYRLIKYFFYSMKIDFNDSIITIYTMMGIFGGTYRYIRENIMIYIHIPFYDEILIVYAKKESSNSYSLINKSNYYGRFFEYVNNVPIIIRNPG